jgi:hypothetical protein
LDLEHHLVYERQSLARFPRRSDGSIVWGQVDAAFIIEARPAEVDIPEIVLSGFKEIGGEIVFFWGSLAIPSVVVGVNDITQYMSHIIDLMPEFWMYSPTGRIVLELAFSGGVTVARVPTGPGLGV